MSRVPSCLEPTETDIQMLLSASCHIGSKNCDRHMEPYVWKRRSDGIHLLHLGKTWEKLILAARAIVAIENPGDICILSGRPYGQRAALKFAHFVGAQAISGRFTPGTFTNYITRSFKEPRLIIVTDPRTDHQAIKEASYVNIPVIALCDTDSPLRCVDIAIPTNNKGKHAIGLIYYLLTREVLRLKGSIPRNTPWDIVVDMFFYRDPEESDKPADVPAGDWQHSQATGERGNDTEWAAAGGTVDDANWGAPATPAAESWASDANWTA